MRELKLEEAKSVNGVVAPLLFWAGALATRAIVRRTIQGVAGTGLAVAGGLGTVDGTNAAK